MSRPLWKGHITFGLVNIPIVLYSAERRFDIHLTLVDSRDKARIHYERVNENTGAEVPWESVRKGYAFAENNYVLLEENELKKIAGENPKAIEIINFVEEGSLSFAYFEKPYYVVPDKKGEKGYVLLRETLKKTKKIGIAKAFIRTKQYLAALLAYENSLMLDLLRYQQELIPLTEFNFPTAEIKKFNISAKEMQIAEQLVDSMTMAWQPEEYHDEYRDALQQWIEEKIALEQGKMQAKPKTRHKKAAKANVINFIDLLQDSLKKTKKSEHGKAKALGNKKFKKRG